MNYPGRKAVIAILIFLLPAALCSQAQLVKTGYYVELKSDKSPKSVLLSNVYTDRVGDQSPFIGVAVWQDSGKLFECRSIVEFDYKRLPEWVQKDPNLIESATLILYPKEFSEVNDSPFIFSVKRVLQPWEDSLTTWTYQPPAAIYDEIKVKYKPAKRNKPVKIDVTNMVKAMFKKGNYGFMLACKETPGDADISQWFASAKNEDKKARPLLAIRYVSYDRIIINQLSPSNSRSRELQLNNTPPSAPAPVINNRNN